MVKHAIQRESTGTPLDYLKCESRATAALQQKFANVNHL